MTVESTLRGMHWGRRGGHVESLVDDIDGEFGVRAPRLTVDRRPPSDGLPVEAERRRVVLADAERALNVGAWGVAGEVVRRARTDSRLVAADAELLRLADGPIPSERGLGIVLGCTEVWLATGSVQAAVRAVLVRKTEADLRGRNEVERSDSPAVLDLPGMLLGLLEAAGIDSLGELSARMERWSEYPDTVPARIGATQRITAATQLARHDLLGPITRNWLKRQRKS